MLSTPSTPEVQNLGGIDPKRVDSNQLGRALPWHIGRHWLAGFYIVQKVYNFRPTTKTSGGGKGGKGATTTTTATCDLAIVVGCCQEDYLEAIRVNGEIVWSGGIERDATHPEHTGDIVVPNVGTFRFHWGTSTAAGDFLLLNSIGEEHPYYRDEPVLEAKGLACSSSGSVPNIEVLPERSGKFPGFDQDRSREGANPITGLAELIGDDFFGCGMPDVVEDTFSAAAAAVLAARTKTVAVPGDPAHTAYMSYFSVYVDERTTFGSLLSGIAENYDGFVRRSAAGDTLELGFFEKLGSEPPGLLELSLHDFVDEPKLPNPGPDDPEVITDTIVKGPDRDRDMQDNPQPGSNDVVRDRIKEKREKTFDRPFICTTYQRKEQAQELALYFGIAAKESTHTFRRAKVGALRQGDRFIINYGPSSMRRVFRVNRRSDPPKGGEVELSIIPDRGIAPLAFIPPPDPTPALPAPDLPAAIVNARIYQVPAAWAGSPAPKVLVLASRPSGATLGYKIHFSIDDATYDFLLESVAWAIRGTLVSSIGTGSVTMTAALSSYDLAQLADQSAAAQADDTLLAIIGTEVCSIGDVTALGGGQYSLAVLRGRRGSAVASHTAGDEVFILPRIEVELLEHAQFPRTAATRWFKLQTKTHRDDQDMASALKLTFTFADTATNYPSAFTATGRAEGITLDWTNPADVDLTHVEFFEKTHGAAAPAVNDVADFTWPVVPGGKTTHIRSLTAGLQRDYYIRAVDSGGYKSSFVGPQVATALSGSGIVAILTNEAHTVPADAAGTVTSFAGASSQIKIYNGLVDDTANWTISKADTSCTSSLAGAVATVSALSADVGYVDFTATRTGYPTQTKRFTITKSKAGAAGVNAKLVVLTSDAQTFQYPKAGGVNPSSISFTATGQNLTGSPSFSVTAGTATLTGSGTTRALAPGSMSTDAITVQVSWDGQTDYLSVVKVREGNDGSAGTPGAPGTPGSNGSNGTNGTNGTNGANSAVVFIFKRASSTPSLPSATTTYTFSSASLTGLNNGWTTSVPAIDGNPLYVSAATATSTGSSDTISSGEWASPVIMAQDGAAGSPGSSGINSATVFLFQRTSSSTPPSLPSATVTYTFSTAAASGVNNGWTQTMPTSGGAYRWMTQATALSSSSTDTISSGEWATASLIAQDGANGSNGTNGTNGATILGSVSGGGSASGSSYTSLSPTLSLTVSCDGNARMIQYSSGYIANASGSTTTCYVALFRDSTVIAELGNGNGMSLTSGQNVPVELSAVDTPSSGSHTFSVRVKSAAASTVATGGYLSVL